MFFLLWKKRGSIFFFGSCGVGRVLLSFSRESNQRTRSALAAENCVEGTLGESKDSLSLVGAKLLPPKGWPICAWRGGHPGPPSLMIWVAGSKGYALLSPRRGGPQRVWGWLVVRQVSRRASHVARRDPCKRIPPEAQLPEMGVERAEDPSRGCRRAEPPASVVPFRRLLRATLFPDRIGRYGGNSHEEK